jgi:iron complex outermembrane recepter protein
MLVTVTPRRLSVGALGAFILLCTPAAMAQTPSTAAAAPGASDADVELGEVVVTGSRLASGSATPTPVTVVGAARLEERGETNIADALNEIPAFRPTSTPSTGELGAEAGYVGGRILDLRGLGPVRTLTLVDGKRFTPSTTELTVDTNMIPSIMLDHAEVVTGGASAQYGSDAVSGVVNLILDKKLDGFKSSIQQGISRYGDDSTTSVGLAGGMQLTDRLHFVLGAEFEDDKGQGDCQSRAWCRTETLNFGRNPGSTSIPANNILPNIRPSTVPFNGVTVPTGYAGTQPVLGPVGGITFANDGTPQHFQYGSMVNSLYQVGGQGQGQNIYFKNLQEVAPTQRYALMGDLEWNITDTITGSWMLNYGHLEASYNSVEYRNAALTIQATNPYIPRSTDPTLDIPSILAANGLTSFKFGKGFDEIGPAPITTSNELFRTVFGLQGKFGSNWSWDAYYEYGNNQFNSTTQNSVLAGNILKALDAVTNANGQIVCRANLTTQTAPGCVPYDPFGNQASAAAKAYVTADAFQFNQTIENVVAANLRGDVFKLPAGPVQAAVGVEYRNDSVDGNSDPLSQALQFYTGNASKISGKISVKEGYLESEVPILADLPFMKKLDINGAVRRTGYDRSSDSVASSSVDVTTWKVGAIYEPIDAIRFRATESRDIRAPNVSELYGPNTNGQGILTDPAKGGQQVVSAVTSGSNPNLTPETANTLTLGVVFKPRGDILGRFHGSFDYYDITIKNAISTLGQQNIVTRCFQGDPVSCSLITRDATGSLVSIKDTLQNVNKLINRGFDIEVGYLQPMQSFGNLDMRVLTTHVKDLITVDSVGPTQRAGQTGLRAGTPAGIPDWTIDALITWNVQAFSFTTHARYINHGFYNSAFIGQEQPGYSILLGNSSNTNSVPSKTYVDLLGQYRVAFHDRAKLTLFAGIDNVFDVDPPLIPGSHGTGNNLLFSPTGMMFKAGARFSY